MSYLYASQFESRRSKTAFNVVCILNGLVCVQGISMLLSQDIIRIGNLLELIFCLVLCQPIVFISVVLIRVKLQCLFSVCFLDFVRVGINRHAKDSSSLLEAFFVFLVVVIVIVVVVIAVVVILIETEPTARTKERKVDSFHEHVHHLTTRTSAVVLEALASCSPASSVVSMASRMVASSKWVMPASKWVRSKWMPTKCCMSAKTCLGLRPFVFHPFFPPFPELRFLFLSSQTITLDFLGPFFFPPLFLPLRVSAPFFVRLLTDTIHFIAPLHESNQVKARILRYLHCFNGALRQCTVHPQTAADAVGVDFGDLLDNLFLLLRLGGVEVHILRLHEHLLLILALLRIKANTKLGFARVPKADSSVATVQALVYTDHQETTLNVFLKEIAVRRFGKSIKRVHGILIL
mmetsp:Transcript_26541/g.44306  ORF Transcript_26541/g.44306 Transcript_26541/m.44306 type:complete len:406 (-) Transcript_26541:405-1622(-)